MCVRRGYSDILSVDFLGLKISNFDILGFFCKMNNFGLWRFLWISFGDGWGFHF